MVGHANSLGPRACSLDATTHNDSYDVSGTKKYSSIFIVPDFLTLAGDRCFGVFKARGSNDYTLAKQLDCDDGCVVMQSESVGEGAYIFEKALD